MNDSPWWSPNVHADRQLRLRQRNRIKLAIRSHFERQGFTEVECGALAVSPGNEAHLHAFATEIVTALLGGANLMAFPKRLTKVR